MDFEVIKEKVKAGNYVVWSHAVTHSVKEGFEIDHIPEAVINGTIIEAYPDTSRILICGKVALTPKIQIYLHVVCEYSEDNDVHFVTAYIPDESQWERPPLKRRRKLRG